MKNDSKTMNNGAQRNSTMERKLLEEILKVEIIECQRDKFDERDLAFTVSCFFLALEVQHYFPLILRHLTTKQVEFIGKDRKNEDIVLAEKLG